MRKIEKKKELKERVLKGELLEAVRSLEEITLGEMVGTGEAKEPKKVLKGRRKFR